MFAERNLGRLPPRSVGRRAPRTLGRPALTVAVAALLMSTTSPMADADDRASDPWPTTRFFDGVDPADFALPGTDGVWFLAPTGHSCGIWGRGSFACSGDIPGAPAGTRALGWITGDRAMHYDWTVAWRMPPAQARVPLPARHVLEHQGTTCAVTEDARTYCERGPLRFALTATGSWLTPPWTDRR